MKRDMDLVRQILLEIEASQETLGVVELEIKGYSPDVVSYHVRALDEAGLVEAKDMSGMGEIDWRPMRLTWEGHEFLEAARDDGLWQKAKQKIGTAAGGVTFDILKSVLYSLLREQIGLPPE